MRILFDVSGDVQINREIQRVGAHGSDMSPAFDRVLDLWIDETTEQFATEGGHASAGWAALKPATVEAKRRQGLRPEILRASDQLLRSLTRRGDTAMIAHITPTELEYGSRLPYVGFHQRGTSRMPQRRPVEFTETTRRDTIKILQRYLLTGEVAA